MRRLTLSARLPALLSGVVVGLSCGCGGGGGSVQTSQSRSTSVRLAISWADRSRTVIAPSSALSAVATLQGADPAGRDFVWTINRDAGTAAYSKSYVSDPLKAISGVWPLRVRFCAQPDGGGSTVGTASATITLQSDGTGIGEIETLGTIATTDVPAGQLVRAGTSTDLLFTCRDSSGQLVAVSPGSIVFRITSGSDKLAIVNGQAEGLSRGTATVTGSVDQKTSPAVEVSVGSPDDPLTGKVVFSRTQIMDSVETQISDTVRGIRLTVAAGATSGKADISLEVREHQRKDTAPPGFASSQSAIDLSVDPSVLIPKATILLELPATQPFDPFGSMVIATNDIGGYTPLAVTFDDTRNVLIARISKEQIQSLVVPRTRGRGLGGTIGIFSSSGAAVASLASGKFYMYKPAIPNDPEPFKLLTPDMHGKRIAVLLHGIFSDRKTMVGMAQFLSGGDPAPSDLLLPKSSGGTGQIYDEIWCYEYNWKAQIADNGKLFAQQLSVAMSGADTVEIYAHSMGGLVSRWALEKGGLGASINRLITLGTPHDGVPLQAGQFMLWLIAQKTGIDVSDWMPGVNDLCDKVIENPFSPSFLKQLNDGDSPYKGSADYYTLAGSGYGDYVIFGVNLGTFLNDYWYNAGALDDPVVHDGIVPEYSALSDILSRKSSRWLSGRISHTQTVPTNHHDLGDPGTKLATITGAIKPWIVTSVKGTVR